MKHIPALRRRRNQFRSCRTIHRSPLKTNQRCFYCKKLFIYAQTFEDHVFKCSQKKQTATLSSEETAMVDFNFLQLKPAMLPVESNIATNQSIATEGGYCILCKKQYNNETALADHICNEKDRKRNRFINIFSTNTF